jgi:mono/diheme cytochrome c family protein
MRIATTEDPPDAITYWQQVEPIFQTNCITCHTDGGIGPFPLDVARPPSPRHRCVCTATTGIRT